MSMRRRSTSRAGSIATRPRSRRSATPSLGGRRFHRHRRRRSERATDYHDTRSRNSSTSQGDIVLLSLENGRPRDLPCSRRRHLPAPAHVRHSQQRPRDSVGWSSSTGAAGLCATDSSGIAQCHALVHRAEFSSKASFATFLRCSSASTRRRRCASVRIGDVHPGKDRAHA